MHIYKRNLLTCFILTLLPTILFPTMAMAADKELITLEQAIQTVKQNFEVPLQYTEFTSGFNRTENNQFWSLNNL